MPEDAALAAAHQLGPRLAALLPGMLERAPDPQAAATGWRRFLLAAPAAALTALRHDPSLAEALLAVVGQSQFLTEALVQSPELLLWLDSVRRQDGGYAREEWSSRLAAFTAQVPAPQRAAALTRFQRREILRIVLRDLQGVATLAETTEELSRLADALLEQAHAWAWNELAERFGTPRDPSGAAVGLAVLGLGKLGGSELNYSSDIDLMFLYRADGETAGGPAVTSNREFFTRLAQAITQYVSAVTPEGRAYRVDLRLRPGGREGELALAMPQALRYYRQQARDWELQMLIRARPCAGSRHLAQEFLDGLGDRIYPAAPQPDAIRDAVRRTRHAISAQLEHHRASGRRAAGVDVKLDPGGIRDIEFLVQYLQRLHGGAEPWVRNGNTLVAMQRLHDKRRLGSAEFQALSTAYGLLRQVEHLLQLRLGQQTHTVPPSPERQRPLARSLLRTTRAGIGAAARPLDQELVRHMAEVRRIYENYLGPDNGGGADAAAPPAAGAASSPPQPAPPEWATGGVSLQDWSRHGQRQWQRLQRSALTLPEGRAAWERLPDAALPRLRVALEASDWMAEALIRRPALLAALDPAASLPPRDSGSLAAAMAHLRHWRQWQTLRWLLEEWEQPAAPGAALVAHSQLACDILQAGLECARRERDAPYAGLAVLALGRLGLRELDLLSDLDLVLVAPEGEAEASTRLAVKFIEVLTAYTQQGSLFAVDPRLRPGGGEGELVQTVSSLGSYFDRRADAWEAMSYLKARVVAGDTELGEQALQAVRAPMLRRWGGAGAPDRGELTQLRDRIEREGHPGRWGLKTSPGGYYDVDFLLSRRLLQSGRASQAALAATARELSGSALSPDLAQDLARQAERLRAADHALRVASGKAGAAIPASGEAVERAQIWLLRTSPDPSHLPLGEWVDLTRARIRAIYHEWL